MSVDWKLWYTIDMTTLNLTETFITKVDAGRIIHLPDSVPDGATVAVIVMPPDWQEDEARQRRFTAALKEIENLAAKKSEPSAISDQDLNKLVRKLRKEMSAN